MRFRIVVSALVLLVAGLQLTCAQDSKETADVTDTISKFYESIEAGDPAVRIPLLADDVILLPNHWTIMEGKEVVSESFRRSAEAIFRIRDREVVQMEIRGDIAYTVNSYYYTYHLKDHPEQWHKTKNVHIWRRDSSGAWKLAVDIWNSDVPIEQFSEE